MKKINQWRCYLCFSCLLLVFSSKIHAALITSGCLSSTTCTMSELAAGGEIRIDDVAFTDWTLFTVMNVNLDDVKVSGTSTATSVTLLFDLEPALIAGPVSFYEHAVNFIAGIFGGSARSFTSNSLELTGSSTSGDAFNEVGVNLNIDIDSIRDLIVFEELTASQSTDTANVLNTQTSTTTRVNFQGESFENSATATLTSFRLTYELDQAFQPPTPPPMGISSPTYLSLFMGLVLLFWQRRVR